MRKRSTVYKILISSMATILVIISLLIGGCENSSASQSVSQEEYDKVIGDFNAAQSQIEELEGELYTLQGELDTLQDNEDTLQDDYDTLVDWYAGIREEVNQRLGIWEDRKLFITPEDEDIAEKVQEITGGYSENVNEQWTDFAAMYYWVANNIEYNSDSRLPYLPWAKGSISWSQEYWRMPGETIEDGVGDCEDMATLLASMILNYTSSEVYPCWCITWSSEESGHAAVAFPVAGDRLTILDPAGNYYTSSAYGLGSDDVIEAVDDWLAHWQPEPGIYVSGIFSNTVYERFNSTEEFIDWALAE